MKLYRLDEIENRHGQYIAYWSKQPGNTEIEKFRNFQPGGREFTITDKNSDELTCIVDDTLGPNGYHLICFNNLGESIFSTEDLPTISRNSIVNILYDYEIL